MKFLCLDCDEPMKLHGTEGPHDDSLTVVFRCPECGFRVAMLTNPLETQMVKSLGVKVGGAAAPARPFEHLRASMATARPDAFAGEAAPGATGASPGAVEEAAGPGCPFAAMVNEGAAAEPPRVGWTVEAEARLERVPAFIRPMARKAIERYAEGKGYGAVTEQVMDEARGVMGM
jgi:DNA-directed RNA polymerase subunit RPC12/RpoP